MSRLRFWLQRARRHLYESRCNPRFTPRPSLNDLDARLEDFLDFPRGFFIEAGANDGYSQSNTYFLEFGRGWRGVLVEGIPELYRRCATTRKRAQVFHCALVAPDYPEESITMHYANLMSVTAGAMDPTALEQQITTGLAIQGLSGTYSVSVPARTLESILDEVSPPTIDFFSLDVEGYELNVLRGLNLEKYRPRYVLVEARDEISLANLNWFLGTYRYRQISALSVHDYLYADNDCSR